MIDVISSNGTFTINNDGEIIAEFYIEPHKIVKFDIKEYFQTYPNEVGCDSFTIDILDIGYWTSDGYYEKPEPEFRDDVSKILSSKNK